MGLAHPTEGTYVLMTAILLLASHNGSLDTIDIKGTTALATLRDLKCMMKSWKHGAATSVLEFPPDPEDFKKTAPATYNQAYMHQPPAPCPLDSAVLQQVRHSLPARKTHATVSMKMNAHKVMLKDEPIKAMFSPMVRQ